MTGSLEASRRRAQVASGVAAWALVIVPGGPEVCFDQKMATAFNSQQAVVANDFSRHRPVRSDAVMLEVRPDSRADKVWTAPANRIPVGIECNRAACPIATGTGDRIRLGVAGVRRISWSRSIVVRLTVGYSAPDDSASSQPANNTGTHATAVASRISGGGDIYGTCYDRRSGRDDNRDTSHGGLQKFPDARCNGSKSIQSDR